MRKIGLLVSVCLLATVAFAATFHLLASTAVATSRAQTTEATPAPDETATTEMTGTGTMTGTEAMTDTEGMTGTEGMTESEAMTGPLMATAELQDVDGNIVGMATFTETPENEMVNIHVEISGLVGITPGAHGIHVHQVGLCTPDFLAAGDHFNPTQAKHGLENPKGPHAGDLPTSKLTKKATPVMTRGQTCLPCTLAHIRSWLPTVAR
jgi:hypothetical protein